MTTQEIIYDFSKVPTIKKFCDSNKQIKFIMGPVGSGKSSGCVIHLLKTMSKQVPDVFGVRKTRYAIIRNTTKMLNDTTRKTINSWLPKSIYKYKEARNEYHFLYKLEDGTTVESEWLMRALDDEAQIRDLLSLELTGAWINEAREIEESIFQVLRTRISRYPSYRDGGATYPYIILDSNPCYVGHWLYNFFEVLPKDDQNLADIVAIFKQPSGLSPEAENIGNLPANYYRNISVGQDEDFIKVYVHGEYGVLRAGMAVFSAYRDSIHYSKNPIELIKVLPITIGMDFGLYPACVVVQFLPDGRLHVLDELVTENPMDVETFITDRLLPLYRDKYRMCSVDIIGDASGISKSQINSKTCFGLLREYGFEAYPAYTNSLQDRIKAVNFFLTRSIDNQPAFKLSSTCETLRKGFLGDYHFRKLRTTNTKFADYPEKNIYSHIMDALQYACLSIYPKFKKNLEHGYININNNQPTINVEGFV